MALMLLLGGCGELSARQAGAANSRHGHGSGSGITRQAPPPPPDCLRVRCVALTFDDGPGEHTARLLGHLRRARARATFFVLGENVREHAEVLRQVVRDGHEVADHSWSHPNLTHQSSRAVRSQVRRTQREVAEVAGVTPRLFRPPYGATDSRVARAAGMAQILWDVDTLDWLHQSSYRLARLVTSQARRGSIVLMHDIHRSTVAAIPRVLSGLKRRGFHFATVSDLLRAKNPRPGHSYLHG